MNLNNIDWHDEDECLAVKLNVAIYAILWRSSIPIHACNGQLYSYLLFALIAWFAQLMSEKSMDNKTICHHVYMYLPSRIRLHSLVKTKLTR